jgi:hypothetical protein
MGLLLGSFSGQIEAFWLPPTPPKACLATEFASRLLFYCYLLKRLRRLKDLPHASLSRCHGKPKGLSLAIETNREKRGLPATSISRGALFFDQQ